MKKHKIIKESEQKDDFHVDMSGKIYKEKTIGIAIVGTKSKAHFGCALKGNLVKFIMKNLFVKNLHESSAKLYAICIFILLKKINKKINTLIICNDENFGYVKKFLLELLKNCNFNIINISEFREQLGRNIGSLADNYARIYRKKALKKTRLSKGKKLNIVEVNFKIIKQYWEELK